MNRLSLFADMSGVPSKESQSTPFFNIGGVIIPTDEEGKFRTAIGSDTPKWRDANGESLALIEDLLKSSDIHCTAVKVQKTEPAWTIFWTSGEEQYQELNSSVEGRQRVFRPGNVLKIWAITRCFGRGLGDYIRLQGRPTVLGPDGFSALYLKYVCDTDIQGQDNREMFEESLRQWSRVTKLPDLSEVRPYIEGVEFKTEQEEALLILPDYLSGYVRYSTSPESITPPKNLSEQDIRRFGKTLSSLKQFTLVEQSFDRVFPNLIPRKI